VYVLDLTSSSPELVPATSNPALVQRGEVTCLSWNPSVPHVVASGSADGSVFIFNYATRQLFGSIPTGAGPVADIAWHPTDGVALLTASAADASPVIQLWDLRSSTTLPRMEVGRHAKGLLSLSWCPQGASRARPR
jgi:protein transport protein SEC31